MATYPSVALDTPYGTVRVTVLDENEGDDKPIGYQNSYYDTDDNGNSVRKRQLDDIASIQVDKETPIVINGIAVYGSHRLRWHTGWNNDGTVSRRYLWPEYYYWNRLDGKAITDNIRGKIYDLGKLVETLLTEQPDLLQQARRVTLLNRTEATAATIAQLRIDLMNAQKLLDEQVKALALFDAARRNNA